MTEDMVLNPFSRYPANELCMCGSGHKWRRCHAKKIAKTITKSEAEKVEKFLKVKFGV